MRTIGFKILHFAQDDTACPAADWAGCVNIACRKAVILSGGAAGVEESFAPSIKGVACGE